MRNDYGSSACQQATDLNPAEGDFAETLKAFMAVPRYGATDDVAAMVAYLSGFTA